MSLSSTIPLEFFQAVLGAVQQHVPDRKLRAAIISSILTSTVQADLWLDGPVRHDDPAYEDAVLICNSR